MAGHGISVLQIAVPSPLRRLFDYLPPDHVSATRIKPGMRVRVPFGHRHITAMVVGHSPSSDVPRHKIRKVVEVIDTQPLFSADHLRFLIWSADYYQYPVGEVIANSLPAALRQGKPAATAGVRFWSVTAAGMEIGTASLDRSPRQREVLETLRQHGEGLTAGELNAMGILSRSALKSLEDKGLITARQLLHHESRPSAPAPTITLTGEQRAAIDTICSALDDYGCFLLNGVTGSGKTEIYMRVMQKALQQDRQVLILLPEIGLTPQFVHRLEQGTGCSIAVYHSGLSDRERLNTWLLARDNRIQVVLGTRSAIWIPLGRPGLFIVDEEHDPSYKQQESFRYSARDLALVRARNAACPVVLGSATASLESLHNRSRKEFREIVLNERVATASLPNIRILDMKHAAMNGALCESLTRHIDETLKKGRQVLVFQNRRGYSPACICHDCGWMADCDRCDKLMTLHKKRGLLWCHHCDRQTRIPEACPECGQAPLLEIGHGTERIEEELRNAYPDHQVIRIDRDSTRRKGSMAQFNDDILSGRANILVGTQMLAKGHHFPKVTLVVIIDVDSSLYSTDFRATERMAQLITQVSGRAGRGDHAGTVIIQTHFPDHPLLQSLLEKGYMAFTETLLAERREAGLPPFSFMAMLRTESSRLTDCEDFLNEANTLLREQNNALEIAGPLPAPMERKAGRYRMQMILQSSTRHTLNESLRRLLPKLENLRSARRVRWSVDVDPQDMM